VNWDELGKNIKKMDAAAEADAQEYANHLESRAALLKEDVTRLAARKGEKDPLVAELRAALKNAEGVRKLALRRVELLRKRDNVEKPTTARRKAEKPVPEKTDASMK
jgi:hypothetical protein